jgi:hypothetical protein
MVRTTCWVTILALGLLGTATAIAQPAGGEDTAIQFEGIEVGTFPVEVRTNFTREDGLASNNVNDVAVHDGVVYAATARGLSALKDGSWSKVAAVEGAVTAVATHAEGLVLALNDGLYQLQGGAAERLASYPSAIGGAEQVTCLSTGKMILLGTNAGLFSYGAGKLSEAAKLHSKLGEMKSIRQIAQSSNGEIAVAAATGLYAQVAAREWEALHPRDTSRSWAPYNVQGVAFDTLGQLWFASPQGVGHKTKDGWQLYEGKDGLPYNGLTCAAADSDGAMWFGTGLGAIHYDGEHWAYRQGPRWLPGDEVRAVSVDSDGTTWFATQGGVGRIERKPMTLAEKAQWYNDEIDKYHRRTPYGYVLEAGLEVPYDKSSATNHDSDNDGLWTAMYAAAECFRYAATKDPVAKERATKSFEAVAFLSEVTQGGSHPAPRGFPARSILPTNGWDPNTRDNPERDKERKAGNDPAWKILGPRWPVSEDGKWYWKTDTSSDELDGHYFLYALYYDLVAETEAEKDRARDVIARITDHLIENDYALIDHDGTPTRWGQFGPKVLNHDLTSGGRGLNSLSILSYLRAAEHITGDSKYLDHYYALIKDHAYAMNITNPKRQSGPGTGNQSDDEMAFMGYYNLLNYETDPELLQVYLLSLSQYWALERPELNPLFNYIFAACLEGKDMGRRGRFLQAGEFLEESLDTLKRFPLDLIHYEMKNSHRIDMVPLSGAGRFSRSRQAHRVNGYVLPVDERQFNHWNHSPWTLDYGGNGTQLADGTSYLLPYYMGLYHGFIVEE